LQNGEEREFTVAGGSNSWASIASSVASLAPDLIEALDRDGKALRATRIEEFDERRRNNAPADVPAGLLANADPETARVVAITTHFSNLLHRAYEHTTDIAFDKMVSLMELQSNWMQALDSRLARTEAAYRRTLQDQVDDAFDEAEAAGEAAAAAAATGDPAQGMIQAFMQGMQQGKTAKGGAPPPPNGKANGKGRAHG
jgi:hypothetical protein